jgi:hypothetical protein
MDSGNLNGDFLILRSCPGGIRDADRQESMSLQILRVQQNLEAGVWRSGGKTNIVVCEACGRTIAESTGKPDYSTRD